MREKVISIVKQALLDDKQAMLDSIFELTIEQVSDSKAKDDEFDNIMSDIERQYTAFIENLR